MLSCLVVHSTRVIGTSSYGRDLCTFVCIPVQLPKALFFFLKRWVKVGDMEKALSGCIFVICMMLMANICDLSVPRQCDSKVLSWRGHEGEWEPAETNAMAAWLFVLHIMVREL